MTGSPAAMPPSPARRVGEFLLKVLGVFVILEPIWMLLPFAGFLYGSVLRIESLSRHPSTAWLTHFVFPVLTLGFLGPALAALGLAVFFVGAGQIYRAKLRKTGLVTGGLYRFVRHPQYVALTLFGLGILLTWGRAIAWVGFFLMMYLYYWLAKSEERNCRRLFGEAYEEYRGHTSFVLPGDRGLRGLGARIGLAGWPAPVRVLSGLAFTLALCFGSLGIVNLVKRAVREVPFLTARIELAPAPAGTDVSASTAGGIPFVRAGRLIVVRGPYRNAAAPGFAEAVLVRLPGSAALASFLAFLGEPGDDLAVAFGLPFDAPIGSGPPAGPRGPGAGDGRGPPPDPAGPDRVRLMVFRLSPAPGATLEEAFADPARRTLRGAVIAPVDLGRPEGEDVVSGEVFRPGPGFPAEDRWDGLTAQSRANASAAPATAAVPGAAGAADLVMVRAPILRTRIDPAFADLLLARLLASKRFRERIRASGAGGDLVPIAFPRPGPNWYREHHGKAQISFFVILAKKRDPAAPADSLFTREGRDLIGAFTVEMDLGVEPPADPVGAAEVIGGARDLEERFDFFLSGL